MLFSRQSASKASLEYKSLDVDAEEIRILTIQPNRDNFAPLVCSLEHWPCKDQYPVYYALSYFWGLPGEEKLITVNGRSFGVRDNLYEALRELRRRDICKLWVDAICINQKDERERSHQVPRMGDVFRNATMTVAWLSPNAELAQDAFTLFEVLSRRKPESEFVRFMSELTSTPSYKHLIDIPRWDALRVFMSFRYWARTWIIQEIALSREVMFVWGRSTLNIDNFVPAMYLLQDRKPKSGFFEGYRGIMGILHIINRIDDKRRSNMELQTVLSYSSHSLATEPHDKIFGILGLCTDGRRVIPDPDYRKPLDQIFRELTIRRLQNGTRDGPGLPMDLICMDQPKYPRRDNLPSWVTDWCKIWESSQGDAITSCIGRDLRSGFQASGRLPADVEFSQDELTMIAWGYIFDTINEISERTTPGYDAYQSSSIKPPLELSINTNVYGQESDLYQAIWRSLVHDRVHTTVKDVPKAPAIFGKHFRYLFSDQARALYQKKGPIIQAQVFDVAANTRIYGRRLFDWSLLYGQDPQSSNSDSLPDFEGLSVGHSHDRFEDFIKALRLNNFYRRVMVTRKGYVGIAHAQSVVGDSVALLQGCTMPMILRACGGGWRVVGEAYVHGIMGGEFWNKQDRSTIQKIHLK